MNAIKYIVGLAAGFVSAVVLFYGPLYLIFVWPY
jgi:tetrahydromethanopterin S-methyltransferase subunit F